MASFCRSAFLSDDVRMSGALPFVDRSGKQLVDPRLDGARTAIIVTVGQSLITNRCDDTYACLGRVENLSIADGLLYTAVQPLLGCGYGQPPYSGNYAMRIADALISADLYERVILVPIAMGGSLVSDWASGGGYHGRISIACARLASCGHVATHILWHQGESDHATSYADYKARLSSVVATFRDRGVSAPFYVAQATYLDGETSVPIRTAQADIVNGTDILAGPDIDTLGSAYRYDNTHLNESGAVAVTGLWMSKLT